MRNGAGVTESQLDGSIHHLLPARRSGAQETLAVEPTPMVRLATEKIHQPIEVFLVLFSGCILDRVEVDDAASGIIAQRGVMRLVIHEDDIPRFGADSVMSRKLLGFYANGTDGFIERLAVFHEVAARNDTKATVVRTERIQIDGDLHAEEAFGTVGVVMPPCAARVDDAFAYGKDEIIPEQGCEDINKSLIVE